MIPILLITAFVLAFTIRGRWVVWQTEAYHLKAVWFCWRTKQSPTVLKEMLELWPTNQMILEMWRWDFSRYVVHHGHLEEMDRFIERELAREDLGMELFEQEKKNNPDLPAPDSAKIQSKNESDS